MGGLESTIPPPPTLVDLTYLAHLDVQNLTLVSKVFDSQVNEFGNRKFEDKMTSW